MQNESPVLSQQQFPLRQQHTSPGHGSELAVWHASARELGECVQAGPWLYSKGGEWKPSCQQLQMTCSHLLL